MTGPETAQPKTVMVTGAGGFIGRSLIARMAAAPDARLIAVHHAAHAVSPRGVTSVSGDLADSETAEKLVRAFRPDTIVHAAGRNKGAEGDLWRDNVLTAKHLLDAAERVSPRPHLILLGSAAEYGINSPEPIPETAPCHPATAYGRTKLAATQEAMRRAARGKADVTVLRPFNLIGPGIGGELVLGAFLERLSRALPVSSGDIKVTMGRLDAVRDFVPLADLLAIIEAVAEKRICGEIINVCSGRGRATREILQRVAALAGLRVEIVSDAAAEASSAPDIVIGDPQKGRRLTGRSAGGDLDQTLWAAWEFARTAASRGAA